MPIRLLPIELANQIAAGEVVERPASVVKELIENCLDAGASDISIDIEQGGHKRILVSDNGAGIAEDELPLALSRHATSKISCSEDLAQIGSLGFRGEALASIASVSRLTLTSRTQQQSSAFSAYCEGREMQVLLKPAAHAVGTSVDVQDLFYNTPARRRFLRAIKTEFSHIDSLIKRFALSRFDVAWTLRHNGKVVRQFRKADSDTLQQQRIRQLLGNANTESMQPLACDYHELSLRGWLLPPSIDASADLQHFFVNGRVIRDKLLQHAVRQGFAEHLTEQQQPCYILYLQTPLDEVDVNVHPAKHEVRFHQARLVHDFIVKVIKDALSEQLPQLTAFEAPQQVQQVSYQRTSYPNQTITPSSPSATARHQYPRYEPSQAHIAQQLASLAPVVSPAPVFERLPMPSVQAQSTPSTTAEFELLTLMDEQHAIVRHAEHLGVVSLRQLYAQAAAQHWLEQQQNQQLVSQPLLLPARISLTLDETEQLQPWVDELNHWGFSWELTKQQILVRRLPSALRQLPAADLIQLLLSLPFCWPQQINALCYAAAPKQFSQQEAKDWLQRAWTARAREQNWWRELPWQQGVKQDV